MNTRRQFIRDAALLGGAIAFAGPLGACRQSSATFAPVSEIGLQLYSIRDVMSQDPIQSLKKVAGIGYKHVETYFDYNLKNPQAKFWGLDVATLKRELAASGLKTYSGHYQLHEYLTRGNGNEAALKYQLEIAAGLGQQYFIIPVPPLMMLDQLTADDFRFMALQLNKAGEQTKKAGIKIGYHNHFWEFRDLGQGQKGLDILLSQTEPDLVTFEMDLFWAKKSGIDPNAYFAKYPGRFAMWHVKDMDRTKTEPITGGEMDKKNSMEILQDIGYTEVGSGAISFKEIFSRQEQAGLQHIFVEQDVIKKDVFVSIAESFAFVEKNLLSPPPKR